MLAVIDYGAGNLRSVLNALERVGTRAAIVRDPAKLESAEKLILPGVGAFGDAMRNLEEGGFVDPLRRLVAGGKPLLGVCVGMQLLASRGFEHGERPGLGLIAGEVRRIETAPELRIPHVGWNEVDPSQDSRLLEGLARPMFYFVHSYNLYATDPTDVAGTADYGAPLTAVVERGNVFGVQFHPEKSQDDGLRVLENFLNL